MKTPCYIILATNTKTGEIQGRIENSFSMGLSDDFVRVERAWEYNYTARNKGVSNKRATTITLRETCNKLNQHPNTPKDVTFNFYRVGSKHCPVKLDWVNIIKRKKKEKGCSKFDARNLRFKIK